MKVKFLGAAGTVTGSCYLVQTGERRFAVDCGMHQGSAEIEKRNRDVSHYNPERVEFILVTHAHIDHSGLLPRMVREGFRGRIFATPPTRDLLEIMLEDSAHIQEMETEWQNRKRRRRGRETTEPLYAMEDAVKTIPLIQPVEYNQPFEPAEGVRVTFFDAGHILGSAFLEIEIVEEGNHFRLVFSGDLGRPDQLLIQDPSKLRPADYLFLESTYGDRNHKDESSSRDELAEAIAYSYAKGQKVIIPAFAVERTQEILYSLYLLRKEGRLPADMPVYLDSPLAIKATTIFRKHAKYFDAQAQALLQAGEDPLTLPNLKLTVRAEESMAIDTQAGSGIVISASGMCNAGRIKHHLRHHLWREGASVVFVGYQAQGTPGRHIVDGASKIRILGEEVAVRAKVFTIGGFSAHAGQSQILDWLEPLKGQDMQVFLVHGEERPIQVLGGLIQERFGLRTYAPSYLEECTLAPGKEPVRQPAPELAQPRINWDFLVGELETKVHGLRQRLAEVEGKPWVEQTEIRDRLLEVNNSVIGLLSEL